jgi:hypothetical protein
MAGYSISKGAFFMDYELMHRELPVAVIDISMAPGRTLFRGYRDVILHNHMPIGTTQPESERCDPDKIARWWNERAIPKERSGLQRIMEYSGLSFPNELLLDSFGLSLSDQYWMRPAGSGILWQDVNFFDNPFSDELGNILLGHSENARGRTFVSPDASSSGMLPKKWIIRDGKRILMKGGKPPNFQEPENELIASRVMSMLGVSHVDYEYAVVRGKPYSLCETFADSETDFISAYYIADRCINNPGDRSQRYDFFIKWCDKRGIPGARVALDKIFVIDFLLNNDDRHYNNFGALRDARTLEWTGFSPIFDTGNCLWTQSFDQNIRPGEYGECQPFRSDFRRQLQHVVDFSWIDTQKLRAIPDEVERIFAINRRFPPDRAKLIRNALEWRVREMEKIIQNPKVLRDKPHA